MPFPNAIAFLKLAGFTEGEEYAECTNYNPNVLVECN